jgi:hypothetical protein
VFANGVAEVPKNGEMTTVLLLSMNKIKRDSMLEILDKYIKRGIVEASASALDAPDFFVKKQH